MTMVLSGNKTKIVGQPFRNSLRKKILYFIDVLKKVLKKVGITYFHTN